MDRLRKTRQILGKREPELRKGSTMDAIKFKLNELMAKPGSRLEQMASEDEAKKDYDFKKQLVLENLKLEPNRTSEPTEEEIRNKIAEMDLAFSAGQMSGGIKKFPKIMKSLTSNVLLSDKTPIADVGDEAMKRADEMEDVIKQATEKEKIQQQNLDELERLYLSHYKPVIDESTGKITHYKEFMKPGMEKPKMENPIPRAPDYLLKQSKPVKSLEEQELAKQIQDELLDFLIKDKIR